MARKPKTTIQDTPAVAKPNCLTIDDSYVRPGDRDVAAVTARALAQPEVRAASVIQEFEGNTLDINAEANELRAQIDAVQAGNMQRPEAMLVAQSHTLDALFSNLARRAHGNMNHGNIDRAECYLRLALRAQAQCTRTLEVLAGMKNPPVVYARQANISNGPQQVNNGAPPAHVEKTIPSNELIAEEVQHGETLDSGTKGTPSGADQELAAVGEIHRSDYG